MDLSDLYFKEHERHIAATARMNGKDYHSFISADYYSLNSHPDVKEAAIKAIETYGTSLSVGQFSDRSPHLKQLEKKLSAVAGMEASCIFTSCYTANLGAIGVLSKIDDTVFLFDKYCHASIVSAIKNSGVTAEPFKHNNLSDLAAKLDKYYGKNPVVITEGLYSADGDFVDLPGLANLKKNFNFTLYVDEAHSFVISSQQNNVSQIFTDLDEGVVDIISGSLSKALCSTGGFIVSNRQLIERIRMSREYIFSTGITPSNIAASLACLNVLSKNNRHEKLAKNIAYFRSLAKELGVDLGMSDTESPVFTIFPKSSCADKYLSMLEQGILVQPLLYPAVPKDYERLRVLINAAHSSEQIDCLVDSVAN
ncbi:aminotransferase class I/II-fold pyridoxal phosphate-dependent enzyme [Pleionea sediminis]|uniref:aminotransferase class I/II-fold pyridoxal phosphate-dependent enzyme n=1 Tax=Pleionea sediminis TaxID=2569479 RepID=UPI001185D595|nr:pyridoxal phosphate-dependent aminotransferase family protein [Pleionea sediminis]